MSAACEIGVGEELKVLNTLVVDDNDLTGLFDEGNITSKKDRERERGFAGTALMGLPIS